MDKLKLAISTMLIIAVGCLFQSCDDNDEPEMSDIYQETINRGEYFSASMGTLNFRIVNNYPYILPSEGLSNYLEAPLITYVGECGSIDNVTLSETPRWEKSCEIVDGGGYVAKVKWYDAYEREDKTGYIYMYVEKIGDSHADPSPGVFHDEIRVTYRMSIN